MEIEATEITQKSITATQRSLSNMAVLASVVTLVEKVSAQLNRDDALNCSTLAKDTVSHLALSRIRRQLNIDNQT